MRLLELVGSAILVCAGANAQLRVDETASRASLVDHVTAVSLSILNHAPTVTEIRVAMEWLDPDSKAYNWTEAYYSAPPGRSTFQSKLALPPDQNPLFLRLHYKYWPGAQNLTAFPSNEGIIDFTQLAEHAFRLTVVGLGKPQPGKPYEYRVLATHPVTNRPMGGVAIAFGKTKTTTDSNGMAAVHVTPNAKTWHTEDSPDVEGRLGDLVQNVEVDRTSLAGSRVRIETDKPLYQPGQTLHLRILAQDPDGRAKSGAAYHITIHDPQYSVMHSATVTTSRFGIAHTDWETSEHVASGTYVIRVERDDDEEDDVPRTERQVEIRAYDLPTFHVGVTPDRTYYLSGQNSSIEIEARYLFGKPVSSGTVRISEPDSETALCEARLDAQGRAHCVLDLTEARKELAERRFLDSTYVAYVTDAGSNRTEKATFDLRVSSEPVHLYVTAHPATVTWPLFVSTYLPDGKPLVSDVEVLVDGRSLATVHTNGRGMARAEIPPGAGMLELVARAGSGATAIEWRVKRDIQIRHRPAGARLRLQTDAMLYRAGQVIRCTVTADLPSLEATLLAWNKDGKVVYTQHLQLHLGRSEAVIPYNRNWGRELSLAVVTPLGSEYQAGRTVLYPQGETLQLAIRPEKATYRPGEAASVSFAMADRAGKPVESALGVAIVDQAVFERETADRQPNRRGGGLGLSVRRPSRVSYSRDELAGLDPDEIDDELQLVAELVLETASPTTSTDTYVSEMQEAHRKSARQALADVERQIDREYAQTLEFPKSEAALTGIAPAISRAKDPWMQAYRARFYVENARDVVQFLSSGPDKIFGTADDIEALEVKREWFLPYEAIMRAALTKQPDYPTTVEEFQRALSGAGLSFEALRDPWANPLHVSIEYQRQIRRIQIVSAGPDQRYQTDDDCIIASFSHQYFAATAEKIAKALEAAAEGPGDDAAFRATLSAGGVQFDDLRDPWGRPYYAKFESREEFANRYYVYDYTEYNGLPVERRQLLPVKQHLQIAIVRSLGPDGKWGTRDDFEVSRFARTTTIDVEPEKRAAPAPLPAVQAPGTGSIEGTVTDPTGGVIANAEILLTEKYGTTTDYKGRFAFPGIAPGSYSLRVRREGFRDSVIGGIPVRAGAVTVADAALVVGSVYQATVVTAAELPLQTSMMAMLTTAPDGVTAEEASTTPPVRSYFPETLLWNPELTTDAAGRASLRFPMADSVTTWRIGVVGSTEDGRIIRSSAEVKAFQPFIADLAPPRILTAGDEISLPVPVRNYLTSAQDVSLEVSAPKALALLDSGAKTSRIEANESASPLVRLRAVEAAPDAALRVTVRSSEAADAIEKTLSIHPDGRQAWQTASEFLGANRSMQIEIPANSVPGSLRAELKLYPSLLAHLNESMRSMLRKPTGCAEQIISLGYSNLLVLRALEKSKLEEPGMAGRARRNLDQAYQSLMTRRLADGAFSYWTRSGGDVAITAYAVAFLEDVGDLIHVDRSVVTEARTWLSKQHPDSASYRGLVLRALAKGGKTFDSLVVEELGKLAREAAALDDPYAIATFAGAAMDAAKPELARGSIQQLIGLAHESLGIAFWHLQSNTPFYGTGRAGQIETTALVVSTLCAWRAQGGNNPELGGLIERGALFLLHNQDETGSWLSTQSTIRVLEALLAAWPASPSASYAAQIVVNGAPAAPVQIKAGALPISVDVSRFLKPGTVNTISISGPPDRLVRAQVAAEWYQPWAGPVESRDLSLSVRYSETETTPMQPVRADVTVSRTAFRGYGMMIAEIGLPPGAEVDRGTLAAAAEQSGVDSFEVAPDRVTFYVWPRAADLKFSFVFRPRYPMRAQTAPSVLYDYYNPENRAVLPPATLVVR